MSLADVRSETDKDRVDSGFFSKEVLKTEKLIRSLPSGFVELGETAAILRKGIFDIKAETYVESGVPFIRISNLKDGIVSESNLAFISQEVHEQEKKTEVMLGDLAISKTAYPAVSYVQLPKANVSQDVIAYRLDDTWSSRLIPAYISLFLNSKAGNTLLTRQFQGNVQLHLSLEDARTVPVPLFSIAFQKHVERLLLSCLELVEQAARSTDKASLLLGNDLIPRHPMLSEGLGYHRTLQQVSSAERFDAEYFDPAVQATIARLGRQNTKIRDVAELRCESFTPEAGTPFHYIEISDVSQDGSASGETLDGAEAPSRAKWMVRDKDVLTSTVRPVRRLSALIEARQDGAVASSGFAVLQPRGIAPEVLLTYLRLPVICELMDLHTTASMYPAIAVRDILNLPFLRPSADVEHEIVNAVTWARHSRERAAALLERAKRAVDVAIEESEEAALAFLRSFGE